MCGICGIFGFEDKSLLKNMCQVMQHRGPDDSGRFWDTNIGLGNQRLSIIDVEGGHQPVHNENEDVWVVYNGEIYNYTDLKKMLERQGHSFYTNCDTEVLVHLYEEFGDSLIEFLQGMFSFAIWDSNKRRLLLARDTFGIKPLYYVQKGSSILFASEIKAIFQYEEIDRIIDTACLKDYFTYRYIPRSKTMFKNIRKLRPGRILVCENGEIKIKKYWNFVHSKIGKGSEDFFSMNIKKILRNAVEKRLMSDVPLGAYLSGGIDSGSVVGLMSTLVEEPIKTYTVGFDTPSDELKDARSLAEHFETDHHELLVRSKEALHRLPEIIWYLDEPMADPAVIPMYFVSKFAKKDVTVILLGEGSDELFAGYPRHHIAYRISMLPFPIKLRIYAYFNHFSYSNMIRRSSYFNDSIKKSAFLNQVLLFEMNNHLPNDLLLKVDKTTMANSIEARVPFLDKKLVKFAMAIPSSLKLKGGTEKYILRKSMADILPKNTLSRKKHPFRVPLKSWFIETFSELLSQILSDPIINYKQFLSVDPIRRISRRLGNTYKGAYINQLWRILFFELWYRIYINSDKIKWPPLNIDQLV